jgi:hypothetical protein
VDTLFDEWLGRFRRGDRPDPREYLARAGAKRNELAALIDGYLAAAPRAQPDPEAVDLVSAWMRGESPLVALRVRQGLTRDATLDAISESFDLSEEQRPALAARYHELEAGLLDPARISGRFASMLAGLLETTEDVIRTWRPRRLEAAPAFRAAAEPASVASYRITHYDQDVDVLFISDENEGTS